MRSIVSIAFAMALLSGCANVENTRNLGVAVSVSGQNVTAAAVAGYDVLLAKLELEDTYSDELKVLSPASPSTTPKTSLSNCSDVGNKEKMPTTPNVADQKFIATCKIKSRRAAFSSLAKAFAQMQKASDGNFTKDTQDAFAGLLTATNSIVQIDDGLKAKATAVANGWAALVIGQKQAQAIKDANNNLSSVTNLYNELWEADLPVWDGVIERPHLARTNTYAGLPDASFADDATLRRAVTVPVARPYLIGYYKYQVKTAELNEAASSKEKLRKVGTAFNALRQAQDELTKEKPSILDILASIELAGDVVKALRE